MVLYFCQVDKEKSLNRGIGWWGRDGKGSQIFRKLEPNEAFRMQNY